jgi:hypothetical protein
MRSGDVQTLRAAAEVIARLLPIDAIGLDQFDGRYPIEKFPLVLAEIADHLEDFPAGVSS